MSAGPAKKRIDKANEVAAARAEQLKQQFGPYYPGTLWEIRGIRYLIDAGGKWVYLATMNTAPFPPDKSEAEPLALVRKSDLAALVKAGLRS
jgi:hypothetical protein